ncbi:MAG TPA: hypothetical protein VMR75_00075 [Candidatus Saccharimonadales bacterium]|nr:hypothetical protein [Candidatus Saccharimonadales bacterium]
MATEFVRQAEQPLFPEVFWNRPTMKSRSGRLLVVGGHQHEFSLVQAIYRLAEAAGIGECQAIVPDSLRRMVGEAGFARLVPASASGSLGKAALGEILTAAGDFDGVVIGANLTNNAETAVMIESLVGKLEQPVIITEECLQILQFNPALVTGNPRALVVTTMSGLLTLAGHHHLPIAIKPQSGVVAKITILQQLVAISRCDYVVVDHEVLVAAEGEVSLTPLAQGLSEWPAVAVGVAATFLLQHRTKPFAALTTAAFVLAQAAAGTKISSYSAIAGQISAVMQRYDQ